MYKKIFSDWFFSFVELAMASIMAVVLVLIIVYIFYSVESIQRRIYPFYDELIAIAEKWKRNSRKREEGVPILENEALRDGEIRLASAFALATGLRGLGIMILMSTIVFVAVMTWN